MSRRLPEVLKAINPGIADGVQGLWWRTPVWVVARCNSAGLGTLWVAQDASTITSGGNQPDRTRPGRLYRIDPTSNRVLGRPVPLPGIAPTALAVGEGAVLVGELDRKTLTRFNLVP